MGESCSNCRQLEQELSRVKRELEMLKRLIYKVISFCDNLAADTASEISAGNVPQRRYEYLKAGNDTANQVLAILGQAGQAPRYRNKKLFSGLFKRLK